jgi:hypothetical protein
MGLTTMTAPALLMNDDAVNVFVAAPAGIIHRDRMARFQRMVIDCRTTVVHEWDLAAMVESVLLAADAEANKIAAPTAPCSPEMIRQSGDWQADGDENTYEK